MKINFSAMISRLCAAGIAFLGFGCNSDEPEEGGGGELMYGTPTGSFEIHGSVSDPEGNEVPDAAIRVTFPDLDSDLYQIAVTQTDAQGQYSLIAHDITRKVKVVCVPEDPVLERDSTLVELVYKKEEFGNNMWYKGHAEATVEFKLKSKQNNENPDK